MPDMACFIGLNPSIADDKVDDATIKRLIGFCKRWELDGFHVVNLFALRSTDPKRLRTHALPIGQGNNIRIMEAAIGSTLVVPMWGADVMVRHRGPHVVRMLAANDIAMWCFGKTAAGYPRHPVRLPYSVARVPFIV